MRFLVPAVIGIALGVLLEVFTHSWRRGEVDPPAPRGGRRRRRPARIIGFVALFATVLLLVGALAGWLWARSVFDRIEKVEVSQALSHGRSGTNYLLVGADNGVDPDGVTREGLDSARADTIMVLNIEGSSARMMSLNRDLWVTNPATGDPGRLNATYRQGPANLIQAITAAYGIPIDRYIEIDFFAFGDLVDSFGGIDIDFPHPAFDLASGLHVPEAGLVHLDGDQSLAYVRSRHYHEVIGGESVPQPGLPDVNRVQRQQTFLRAIMAKAGSSRNPLRLMSAADSMSGGLRIDDGMGLTDAARFAWRMGRLAPETVVLPVEGRTTTGGAQVLELGPGAEEILATFR